MLDIIIPESESGYEIYIGILNNGIRIIEMGPDKQVVDVSDEQLQPFIDALNIFNAYYRLTLGEEIRNSREKDKEGE